MQPGSPSNASRHRWLAPLAVCAFALVWFGLMGGFSVIDPRDLSWMLSKDWHGHLFGWLFARNTPWQLPFGLAPDLMYPYGSSAAFSDAIPIAAVTTKIFSALLPEAFQFFGLWMCLCVIAQGLVGFQLTRLKIPDAATAALAGMLFATNPIIASRSFHPSLFAQFLVLGLVGIALLPASSVHGARRLALAALAFDFFACGVHAYLGVMCSALTLVVMVRLALAERWFAKSEAAAWLLFAPACSAASFWIFGFFSGVKGALGALGAEGFGEFSADLTTFYNGLYWSRIMPGIMVGRRQAAEGYAYLGLGVLALLALRFGLTARDLLQARWPAKAAWQRTWPILAGALLMMGYALSSTVTYGGAPVLLLAEPFELLGSLTSIFRGSGRFSWPLHALLTLGAVGVVARLGARVWLSRGAIALALVLQVADLDLAQGGFRGPYPPMQLLTHPAWAKARQGYRHLAIHPVMAQWTCRYDEPLVGRVSWVAYTNRMTVNSGLVGRNPPDIADRCLRHLQPDELDPDTLYIVHFPEFLADLLGGGFACGVLDGVTVCALDKKDTPMRRALAEQPVGAPPG